MQSPSQRHPEREADEDRSRDPGECLGRGATLGDCVDQPVGGHHHGCDGHAREEREHRHARKRPSEQRQRDADHEQQRGEAQQPHRRDRHVRAGDEPADEAAAGEQRQRNAAELGAAVTLGEGGEPDLGRAEPDAEADGEADDRHHTEGLERAQDRARMSLVRTPRANRRSKGDEGRPDPADHRRNGESQHRGRRSRQEGDEQRADDERDLLQRCLQRVRGGAPFRVDEHPRPQRAQRSTDRRHQDACSSRTDGDGQERRIEQRESADRQQKGRKDERPRQEDPRLAEPVDTAAGDRSAHRGRHEVRARDRAGRRVTAAVLAHEEQQRQSDHSQGQPRKESAQDESPDVRNVEQSAIARETQWRDDFRHGNHHLGSA